MKGPVSTLTRGWRRDSLRWYLSTSGILGLSITLLMLVSGLFAGMQAETQERVSDFYADDVRITAAGDSAIPPAHFTDVPNVIEELTRRGEGAVVHLEAQAVLSRRGFLETVLDPDAEVPIDVGGSNAKGDEVIALGVLVGIEVAHSKAREPIEKHLVAGALPLPSDPSGSIPLVMSIDRFEQFLVSGEKEEFSQWPPLQEELGLFQFEITSAETEKANGFKTVITRSAHVVGLYNSGVDVLDSFTFVTRIEDVRELVTKCDDRDTINEVCEEPPGANVILVDTNDPAAVQKVAEENGWVSQTGAQFTERYLGQLMQVLKTLSVLMAIFLFLLPAFLITHGVTRQLETHNREIAVCHAIGVKPKTIRTALSLLVIQMATTALVVGGLITLGLGLLLHKVLPPRRDLPLPMDFHVTWQSVTMSLLVTFLSVGIALFIAFRSHGKQPLATTLRAF